MTLQEKMLQQRRCNSILTTCKPYFAMISLQFGYAGMNIISMVSLDGGMNHYVLVVYRQAFATAVVAPLALYFERKEQPKITRLIFVQIFVLGLLGPVIDQNLYYVGLKYTSPTFACAMSNMLPAMTFVLAVIFRMEKVSVKEVMYRAKIVGTIVTVGGALLMTLYTGPVVEMVWSKRIQPRKSKVNHDPNDHKDWFMGSIFVIIATFAWASFFILQKAVLKHYEKHQLTLTSLVCFMGTLQAIGVTFAMEHKPSVSMEHKPSIWSIGWDMNLLAAAYAGIVTSSIPYYVQGLVMKTKGPVFATAFSPLMMIIVAIMGSFFLAEKISLGGIVGSVLIILGLYAVLWGKHKENKAKKEKEATEIPQTMVEDSQVNDSFALMSIQDTEAEAPHHMLPSLAITSPPQPISDTPIKTNQQP